MIRRLTIGAIAVAAILGALAAPAMAHVELDPGEALAGTTTTLIFSFHHGKDGAATTALEVQLPEGAAVQDLPAVADFRSAYDDGAGTVRWEGGPVPDGVEAEFPVVLTLPTEPGVALFPTIQETEAGELAWISEDESEGEDNMPAPRLTLTPNPDATTTTEATTSTSVTDTTEAALPGTTLEAEQRDDGDTDAAPWIIGAGIAAVAAIAIGGTILKRRADKTSDES